jgi:hypothetical protein
MTYDQMMKQIRIIMAELSHWRISGDYRGPIDSQILSPDASLLGAIEIWKHLNPIIELEPSYDSDF